MNNVDKLFELVFARLEKDFEKTRAGLVGDALALLWVSRRGLSESELVGILEVSCILITVVR